MSKTAYSSLSLPMQVSEASTSESRTFAVGFKPAHHFLAGLITLSKMNTTAAMIVKNGEIHLSATSATLSAYGTFLMLEASTATSWTTNSFALSFDTFNWRTLLIHSFNQNFESFWIYKIARSPHLYCLVGEDSEPIKLGEAEFVEEGGIDLRYLARHKVSINLNRQCLREVITTFASKFHHVLMMVKSDSIIWHNISEHLVHHEENGDCIIIEGVEPGDISYLLIEWRDPLFLMFASMLAKDVHIYNLDDPNWRNWILLTFKIREKTSFLYMFRGSDSMLLFGL